MRIVVLLLEVAILGFIGWKAAQGVRRARRAAAARGGGDTFDAIRVAARQLVGVERIADMFAYEIALIYYGLCSWRRRPAEGTGRYTSYRRNAYGSTLAGIGVLLVVELIAVHLIVQHYWSTAGAWILSIISAYVGVWLLSEWQAHRLRPTLITAEALVLRAGLRWEVTIPFERIRSFRRISAVEERPRGALKLFAFGDALFEVTTEVPVEAHGAYGIRKSRSCFWFTIDEAEEFEAALTERCHLEP